jgi:hypothetical protein
VKRYLVTTGAAAVLLLLATVASAGIEVWASVLLRKPS